MGGAHQPADRVLSYPKKLQKQDLASDFEWRHLFSGDWDLQVGGDLLSFTAPGKLGMC